MRYFSTSDGLPHDILNVVSYARVEQLDGLSPFAQPIPNLAAIGLESAPPTVNVSFVNDTQQPIDFSSSFSQIVFFDAEGYAVRYGFLDPVNTLASSIIESGDSITLTGNPLLRTIWPATVVEAAVYLDWEFLEE